MWGDVLKASRMTIAQISDILKGEALSPQTIEILEKDSRVSVMRLVAKWKADQSKARRETERIETLYEYERNLSNQGYSLIAGIDEAGRGPLAGPVTIGCVILPLGCILPNLNDSKKLTVKQREELYWQIKNKAVASSIEVIDVDIIDRMNIYQATRFGMYSICERMKPQPEAVLVDAVPLPELTVPSKSIIGGDALSASIAAASIIAKVERDRIMDELDKEYPHYGFSQHKGYATVEHLNAIKKYGPCPIHRRTFEPVRSWRGSA